MTKVYSEEFLISELHRFKTENGRVPVKVEMTSKSGYPSASTYKKHFKTWNNALKAAGFKINKTQKYRTGFETCCKCKSYLQEGQQWYTEGLHKDEVMCYTCRQKSKSNYINKNLDKNSTVAKGFISQRIVANVLGLSLENDCNCSIGFGAKYDLYDEGRYNYINVKSSYLNEDYNRWKFSLKQKEIPNTFILVGFDQNRKNILHVWICKSTDSLLYNKNKGVLKKGIMISNALYALKKVKLWEVDVKAYNNMLHNMSKKRKDTNGKECVLNNSDLL